MGEQVEKSGSNQTKTIQSKVIKMIMLLAFLLPVASYLWDYGFIDATAEGEQQDFSLYTRASEIATAFGTEIAPDDSDETSTAAWLDNLTIGNSGGLLGYSRELAEGEDGVVGWLTSQLSTSSATYSYDQLKNISPALYGYARYGATLDGLGLIDARSDGSNMERFIYGWLMIISYWLASVTPMLFNVVMSLLTIMNPFRLFGWVISGASALNIPIFGAAADTVSSIYSTIQQLSLIVTIPILLALTGMSIFMFRGNAGKSIMRLVIKVFMIFAGLPLIGATYTTIIEDLGDQINGSSNFADYIVLTQFVDFENWAKQTRLAPPMDVSIFSATNVGDSSEFKVPHAPRELVFAINGTRAGYDTVYDSMGGNKTNNFASMVDMSKDSKSSSTTQRSVIGLLERYRKDESFTSSDYEGLVKSEINQLIKNGDLKSKDVYKVFSEGKDDLLKRDDLFEYKSGWNIYNAGGLTGATDDPGSSNYSTAAGSTDLAKVPVWGSNAQNGGLSPLAMYNFLNTSFDTTSMTVYSPTKASSSFVRESHASVVKTNTGIAGFAQIVESLALIISIAFVGIMYAIGLMQVSVASIPRILSGVFGTAFGSMAFITKLLISTVVLIVEIVGSILLYQLSESILLGFMRGVDGLTKNGAAGAGQAALAVLGSALVGILSLIVSFYLVKNRTKFVKMMEDTVTNAITKIMGGLDSTMNQGNAFHDPNALRGAAQDARILGNDGKIGSEGSGGFKSQATDGTDDPGILQDMKGAISSTLDAKDRDDRNPDTPEMTGKDVVAGAASRFKKRREARGKDVIADTMGPLGTIAGTALGLEDFDGKAGQRVLQDEELEKQALTEAEHRAGQARDFGLGKYDDDDNPKGGVKAGMDENGQPMDVDGEQDVDAAGMAILMNPNQSMDPDEFEQQMAEIDGQSADDIMSDVSIDDEAQSVLESDGVVDASQESMGSIEDAADSATTNPAYSDEDQVADEAMINAVEQSGVSASEVDLDDPDSHPAVDPMSEEYDSYVDGLGEAVDKQSQAAQSHAVKAIDLDKEANALDKKAAKLEAEGSPESLKEAQGLRQQASEKRVEAEAEKKQGRQAMRKAQKLGEKQESAQAQRQEAAKGLAGNQSKPAQAAASLVQAEQNLSSLEAKREGLSQKLDDLSQNDPDNFMAIAKTQDALEATEQRIPQAKQQIAQAEQKAIDALPDDGYQNLHAMDAPQLEAYQKENGLSDQRMQEKLAETPTETEHRRGQRNAAMMLGKMSAQVGETPAETKQKQRAYIQSKANGLYAKPRENAMANLAEAQETVSALQNGEIPPAERARVDNNLTKAVSGVQSATQSGQVKDKPFNQAVGQMVQSQQALQALQRKGAPESKLAEARQNLSEATSNVQEVGKKRNIKNPAVMAAVGSLAQSQQAVQTMESGVVTPQQVEQAQTKLGQAVGKVKSIDRERAAYGRAVMKGSSVNQDHLGRQMQQIQRAKQTDMKQSNRANNVVSQPEKFQNIAKKALSPTISEPTSSYAIPDLSASAKDKGSMIRKREALKSNKVQNYPEYRRKMESAATTMKAKKTEINRLEGRIKLAETQRRMGDVKKLNSQKLRAEQQFAQTRNETSMMKKELTDNVAGLFTGAGYTPKAKNISTRAIKTDMDQTTRALQEYAKIQRQFEKLDGGLSDKSSLAERTRHKQMKNQVMKLKNNLVGVGIRKDQLENSHVAVQAARTLTSEWMDVKKGKI